MGSNYVVKVQYENTLRRLALGEADLDFAQLESRVYDLFRISPTASLLLTYTDKDGDAVTMADDQDLKDALVLQSINPLRLSATITGTQRSGPIAQEEKSRGAIDIKTLETRASDEEEKSIIKDAAVTTETAAAASEPVENQSTLEAPQVAPATSSFEATAAPERKDSGEPAVVPAAENICGQIHFGVECDGCEMSPIIGARFKSIKRVNYDLCQSCFEGSGSVQDDYVKLDQSANGMFPLHFLKIMKQLRGRQQLSNSCGPFGGFRSCTPMSNSGSEASTSSGPAADATPAPTAGSSSNNAEKVGVKHRGVECDGCGMNPIVGPRLISRMRWNYDLCNGCFEKSGGDEEKFQRVEEPASENRVVLQRELRLVSPYGPFGPRFARYVWVLKPSTASASEEKFTKRGGEKAGTVSAGEASKEESLATNSVAVKSDDTQEKSVAVKSDETQESKAKMPAVNTDASEALELTEKLVAGDLPTAQEGVEDVKEVEPEDDLSTQKGLLAKLAAMGFTDEKLNAGILERNDFDLRKTLDDLCAAEEWIPILEDLQDMGFYDAAINRNLLFKYSGNVKRVVKELVQLSKDVGKGKGPEQA